MCLLFVCLHVVGVSCSSLGFVASLLSKFLLRKFLALSNITRPAPTAPPKRHRLTGTSRPRGLDTQVDWSTVRIPRRKFDRDPLHGLGDPIEAEIIESAGLSGVRKEEHTVVLNFHGLVFCGGLGVRLWLERTELTFSLTPPRASGSFTMGDPTQVRGTDIEFAKLLLGNAKCVSSSYRLAPAEKYPCALHDAVSAYLVGSCLQLSHLWQFHFQPRVLCIITVAHRRPKLLVFPNHPRRHLCRRQHRLHPRPLLAPKQPPLAQSTRRVHTHHGSHE